MSRQIPLVNLQPSDSMIFPINVFDPRESFETQDTQRLCSDPLYQSNALYYENNAFDPPVPFTQDGPLPFDEQIYNISPPQAQSYNTGPYTTLLDLQQQADLCSSMEMPVPPLQPQQLPPLVLPAGMDTQGTDDPTTKPFYRFSNDSL